MKKQIGFEYEGYISGKGQHQSLYPPDIMPIKEIKNDENFLTIFNREGLSLHDDLKSHWISQAGYRDNYARLAEMRFFPIDLETNPSKFVDNLFFIKENAFKHVKWSEVEVPEDEHKYSLSELEDKIQTDLLLEKRRLNNFTGEVLLYSFKNPMTIIDNKITSWISDNNCRNRGGGLHINISPVKPEEVYSFITKLHEELFPLNFTPGTKEVKFKSNYRQQLLFRYRNYNGIPGVEYMSLGFNLDELSKEEVLAIFEKIFKTVNKLLT